MYEKQTQTETTDLPAKLPVSQRKTQIDRQIGRQAISSSASELHKQTGKQADWQGNEPGSLFSTRQKERQGNIQ